MENIKNNTYLSAKQNRIKIFFRLCLGLQQLIYKPFNNIFVLLLLVSLIKIWKVINIQIYIEKMPQFIQPVFHYIIYTLLILVPIILFLYLIMAIGILSARKDEGCLILAFSKEELQNGCPILIKRKRIKGTNVTVREYYSNITLETWLIKKNSIAENMNVHYVESIDYGGKNKNNGKRIVLYTALGCKPVTRGDLYDDEL